MLLVYFGTQSIWALALLGLILVLVVVIAIQAHRNRALGGNEELPGMLGEVIEAADARSRFRVSVRGEIWQARCQESLQPGQTIRVLQAHDLLLLVEPVPLDTDVLSGESS